MVTTTLSDFVNNQVPDLVPGPGRNELRSDNYIKYVDIQKHLKPLAYNICQLHHMFLLHAQFFILDKAWLPQAEKTQMNLRIQLAEHKRTQGMILEGNKDLKNQIQSFRIENEDLKTRVQELFQELKLKQEEALKAQEKRDKKRNSNRLPLNNPFSLASWRSN